jgi:UDP-N-acetylmuramoylalanine--D-glutamate ligase
MSKIGIIGGGKEGMSLVEYFLTHNEKALTLCDRNPDLEIPEGVSGRLGSGYLDELNDFDVIYRSPGVRLTDLHGFDGEISSGTKLFFEKCPCPVIGISGTKGKGTCSSLIAAILGDRAKLGGNIGVPAVDFLDELSEATGDDSTGGEAVATDEAAADGAAKAGDEVTDDGAAKAAASLAILELSSFQLQDLDVSPKVAVLLNTTCDHLDYHADVAEYQDAKSSLLKFQDESHVAILNRDYEYFDYYSGMVAGNLMLVSRKSKVFDGAFEEDGKMYFARDGEAEMVMSVSEVGLVGPHNIENILPAICVGKIFGATNEEISTAIREFKGLPHRIEYIREVRGIKFYNDSCSTNPETSIAAVNSFDEPLILIAGGSEKGADFTRWAQKLCDRRNLQTVILIGETADKLENALMDACGDNPLKILRRQEMDEAVLDAYSLAEPGSVVVLSPACASFDLYKNYQDRGDTFKRAVLSLTQSSFGI